MGSLFPRKDDFFDALPRLFDRDHELFSPFHRHEMPKVDVVEKDDHYVIDAELPGFEKDDVVVSYKDDYLMIEGKREAEVNVEEDNYVRKERATGSFKRQFFVGDIDETKIKGAFKNGVLTVTVPKPSTPLSEEKRYRIDLE